jgi:hypothetical protein
MVENLLLMSGRASGHSNKKTVCAFRQKYISTQMFVLIDKLMQKQWMNLIPI